MKDIQRTHKAHQLHCLRHLWQDRNSNQKKKKNIMDCVNGSFSIDKNLSCELYCL